MINYVIEFFFRILKRFKKQIITKKLSELNSSKILAGPYKSVYINTKSKFFGDFPSKLLGIYEEQIQNKIISLYKKKKILINFGASDGYHVIGLVKKKIFKKAIAFEIDEKTRKRLINNIKKNNISSKIIVQGKASFNNILKFINADELKECLFLVDIESEEFNLFTKKNLKYFSNSYLIIEIHQTFENKTEKKFFSLIKKNFKIEKIYHANKNPFKIKALNSFDEDSKWLVMSECRISNQHWLFCTPK